MQDINYWAVVVAAVAAFAASFGWYIVFGKARLELVNYSKKDEEAMKRPQPAKMLIEIIRVLIVADVLAYLFSHLGVTTLGRALHFGLLLWIGFPFVLLTGSVLWDKVPEKLAAIHAGDWLIKLVLMSVIIGTWH